jgi:hypothetical protein
VILDVETPTAEEVTRRVDRPRRVVHEEDAHQPAPQQATDRALDREAVQRKAGDRRQQQREAGPQWEAPADPAHLRVVVQVAGVTPPVGLTLRLGQPADVSVPEAPQPAPVPDVWRVWVALDVGVGVVFAVIGHPIEDRPLDQQ